MCKTIRVTVWNEYRHEKQDEAVKRVYPEGIHKTFHLEGFGLPWQDLTAA